MKTEPPTNFGQTKGTTKQQLGGTLQVKPGIEKKKVLKPSLDMGKPNFNNVYQIIGQAQNRLNSNQMTPYALLNYYSKSSVENVDSMKNLHQPISFTSPDVKERTSKSETAQKTTNLVPDETYKEWTEHKTPQRNVLKVEKGLTESATLAAVRYF